MITACAVASFSVCSTDPMSVLRDFQRRPVKLRQSSNQASDDTGFAYAAGMAADYDEGHNNTSPVFSPSPCLPSDRYSRSFFRSLARIARSFRYSLIGRAGVPQKTTPFPRITFLLGMPLCAP